MRKMYFVSSWDKEKEKSSSPYISNDISSSILCASIAARINKSILFPLTIRDAVIIDLRFHGTILIGIVVLMIIYWFIDKL